MLFSFVPKATACIPGNAASFSKPSFSSSLGKKRYKSFCYGSNYITVSLDLMVRYVTDFQHPNFTSVGFQSEIIIHFSESETFKCDSYITSKATLSQMITSFIRNENLESYSGSWLTSLSSPLSTVESLFSFPFHLFHILRYSSSIK